jgi:hypothetical protein
MVRLSQEFIKSYKTGTVVTVPVANELATTTIEILKQDHTNFS